MFGREPASEINPKHLIWEVSDRVATVTLNIPAKKNPLTFDSYAELRDLFHRLRRVQDIRAVVITGAGGNFCSGGDVNDIIGPIIRMGILDVLEFSRMAGDVIKEMRACPQPILAAVDGICVGAGAVLAMASDFRYATARTKTAFLFSKVGVGCDMGACAILPRLIGQGRASELLYTGRVMSAEEGERWGFFNELCEPDALLARAQAMARELANGPTFAHGITKRMLHQEWNMSVDEAIEAEAMAQTICTQTEDYRRAYQAFTAKQKPNFEGN